jgi:hypothetical protein
MGSTVQNPITLAKGACTLHSIIFYRANHDRKLSPAKIKLPIPLIFNSAFLLQFACSRMQVPPAPVSERPPGLPAPAAATHRAAGPEGERPFQAPY